MQNGREMWKIPAFCIPVGKTAEKYNLLQICIRFPRSDFLPKMERSRSYVTDKGGNMNRKDMHKVMEVIV